VCSDIDRTLIKWSNDSDEKTINADVVEFLKQEHAKGKEIIIFTGGAKEGKKELIEKMLAQAELQVPFPIKVFTKDEYRGCAVDTIIDDSIEETAAKVTTKHKVHVTPTSGEIYHEPSNTIFEGATACPTGLLWNKDGTPNSVVCDALRTQEKKGTKLVLIVSGYEEEAQNVKVLALDKALGTNFADSLVSEVFTRGKQVDTYIGRYNEGRSVLPSYMELQANNIQALMPDNTIGTIPDIDIS